MSEDYQKKFHKRLSVEEVEEGNTLSPKFDENGLIPCVTTDSKTNEVLMVGYMNAEALVKTIETVWHKGQTSGLTQKVKEIRIDDDQDSIWLIVDVGGSGASCHVGYKSCFYRSIPLGKIENSEEIKLEFKEKEKKFDPEKVYKGHPNPTKL